jgi:hypothetical protein
MKTYGQLFDTHAKEGNICIGLLRGLPEDSSVGPCLNRLPYVFTNPPIGTIVYRWDKVFVLSQRVLTSTNNSLKVFHPSSLLFSLSCFSSHCLSVSLLSSLTPLQEVLESFAHANNCVSLKRNINMEDHSSHQDINEISSTQRALEKAISSLTVDVATRFEDIIGKQKQINESLGASPSNSSLLTHSSSKSPMMIRKIIDRMNSKNASFGAASPSTSSASLATAAANTDVSSPSSSNRTPLVDRSNSRSSRIKKEIKRRKSVVKKVDFQPVPLKVATETPSEPSSSLPSSSSTPERPNLDSSHSQSTSTSPTHSIRAETPFQLSSLMTDDEVEV